MTDNERERAKWDNVYSTNSLPPKGSEEQSIYLEVADYAKKIFNNQKSKRVLEAGSGSGLHSLALAKAGFDVEMLDFSDNALDTAKKIFQRAGLVAKQHQGDILAEDGLKNFDLVFNSGVLEHYSFEEQVGFVRGMALRSRKYVLVIVPNRECYWYWVWRVKQQSLSNWPWGYEKPALDYTKVFSKAGVRLIDKPYFGSDWTEWYIASLGLPNEIQTIIQEIHRIGIADINTRSYLVGFLGIKEEIENTQNTTKHKWIRATSERKDKMDQLFARAADVLSLAISTQTRLDTQVASLNQLITERDRKILDNKDIIDERDAQIAILNNEIMRIKQSISWRLTSPLRITKKLVVTPKRTSFEIIRLLYWRLPTNFRLKSQGLRRAFIRYARGLPLTRLKGNDRPNNNDISWSAFNKMILSKRDEYKGIFIQEVVIDWNLILYQRPQHIATALGRLGYLVIYCTNNTAADDVNGFRRVEANVWVTNSREVEGINGAVWSVYSGYYMASNKKMLGKRGENSLIIYEYIDQIDPEISGNNDYVKLLLDQKEFFFGGGADFVIASAKKLYNEAASVIGKDKVILVPNGVDTSHYRNACHLNFTIPDRLFKFKNKYNKVVGYFGALAPWLWYDAIAELSRKRPDLGFVFIGSDYLGAVENLPRSENVLYIGAVDYKILPAYARQFDVCFIPFKPGDIAKTTSPLKLFEYFALERPVVATSFMDECVAYDEVFVGSSADELGNAIDLALQVKDSEDFKSRLQKLADQNDWMERAKVIEKVFKFLNEKL